jgi:hypothetical protein
MLALVLTLMLAALVVLGAVALRQQDRIARLERQVEVEQRHREHLTLLVERLQDRAAGVETVTDGSLVGVVLKNLGPSGFQQ